MVNSYKASSFPEFLVLKILGESSKQLLIPCKKLLLEFFVLDSPRIFFSKKIQRMTECKLCL
jgi:hypothetical protein